MEASQFKDLLKKYEENTLSPQEMLLLERWYDSYEADDFNGFYGIEHKAKIKAEMRSAIIPSPSRKNVKFMLWRKIYTYAAIIALFIPLLFLFKYQFRATVAKNKAEELVTFTSTADEHKILKLQDNSIIHLNPSSTIKVSARFGTLAQRDVFLEKGNAFFEVAKDRRHPFIVHTQFLSTRVLGTKFKVSTNLNATTEVSVSEGKVQVSQANKVLALLLPGKKLVFNAHKRSWHKSDFGISDNNQWYKAVTNLNQASFDQLASTFKIYYGIRLICNNPHAALYSYNLQIRSERTLDQTIRMICSVHRNQYRRAKDAIVIY